MMLGKVFRHTRMLLAAALMPLGVSFAGAVEIPETPCILSMTYKDIGKPGYMDAAPSDEGLYKALLSEATHQIGCQLHIFRYPKKRTHQQLELGQLDLYPSTGFEEERASYLYFAPNGLSRHERYYGLAPANVGELKSIEDINTYHLTWVGEAGSTAKFEAADKGVPYVEIPDLTDERAIGMLSLGRRIFYRIIEDNYTRFLDTHEQPDITSRGISIHKHCCGTKFQDLYVGISRHSPIYQEEANPHWNPEQALSPENFPVRLARGSIAYQLANALQQMANSGRTAELFDKYITQPGHTP